MVRSLWFLLLVIPSVSAIGVDVDPVSVGIDLPPHGDPLSGGVYACALTTCVGDPGDDEQRARSASSHSTKMGSSSAHDSAAGSDDLAWAVALPAAGILAFLAKLYWLGPGRLAAFIIGPGRLLGIGLMSKFLWPTDLENETRASIVKHLQDHPGASIQEVRKTMSVAWGTAVYHLQRLERGGDVVSIRSGNRHRYWIAGSKEAGVRHAWAVLEQPLTAKIAAAVQDEPGIHQSGLCERLQVNTPTASKHLKRLVTYGLVQTKRVSRFILYAPTERLEQVMQLRAAKPA